MNDDIYIYALETASSLYDGGWRASDREDLKSEYHFDDQTLDLVCAHMHDFEIEENEIVESYYRSIEK